MTIKPQDIDSLVEVFESSDWDELHLKIGDFELFLSTDPLAQAPRPGAGPGVAPVTAPGASFGAAPPAGGPGAAAAATSPAQQPVPAHWVAVTAPNLGTFYRAAKPGAAPFVDVGQAVEPDTEVCLIEVMKLFTTLKAGTKGIVRRVCVQDAVMVEFGDTLFYIEPA